MNEQNEKHKQKKDASNSLIYAGLFLAGLFVFEFIFFYRNAEFGILVKHFGSGNYAGLLSGLLISLTSLALSFFFFYAAFSSPYRYRIVYFLFFALIIFNEYGYYTAYGRFSVFQDAEVAFFSTNWNILSNAVVMYFNCLALIPITIFGLYLFQKKPVWKKGGAALFLMFFILGGFFFLTSYFTRNAFYTISFSSGVRTLIGFPTVWYVGSVNETPRSVNYKIPRDEISFHSSITPHNNIVFIIDESVRGDRLSINGYDQPTTPFLEELKQKNFLKNWGVAVSGTTCSGTSNNLMLTGVTDLPDQNYSIYKMPTIFRYARAMNYKTYYIDGQVSGLWNGKSADIPDFGEWIKESELSKNVKNKYEIDAEIARRIKKITGNSTGNFIWVNKYGVHKPYTDSYPNAGSEAAKDNYKIDYNSEIDNATLKKQYDNAISYNSQNFFSELFNDGGLATNTFYVYTSDHGQTLGENGSVVSHCSTTKPEAAVPLFIIAEPDALPSVDTNYKASHSNIFATLLDLMSFPESERKYTYSISLIKAKVSDSTPRFYFSGDLTGKDESRKYPFD